MDYETNYIVTHTDIFAAALSTAGPSNIISFYGGLIGDWFGGNNGQSFTEYDQFRMGKNLWEAPSLYIKNSPIFSVDKVKTPILLMNNKKDYTGTLDARC